MNAFEYIRNHYKVPAKRGGRVRIHASLKRPIVGTITDADVYLHVRPDLGQGYAKSLRIAVHPLDLEYLES